MVDEIQELNKTVATATNTKRLVVACASRLDTMERRFGNGRLDAMLQDLEEQRVPKLARVQKAKATTAEAGTQTDLDTKVT